MDKNIRQLVTRIKNHLIKLNASVSNLKHRLILMLTYSVGLRVGEVVKLKPDDIDIQRGLIHVKGAKEEG